MNKYLLLFFSFPAITSSIPAQTTANQSVSIKTTLETDPDTPFMIKVKAPKGQDFFVDFGDGSGEKMHVAVGDRAQTISHSFEDMSANKEHTIKVRGDKFEEFWVISNKQATEVVMENCSDLLLFSAANNLLTDLNLLACPKLTTVIVNNNLLTKLPLPATVKKVDFSRNLMAIGDFPTKTSLMGNTGYTYGPMRPYSVPSDRINGLKVDLGNMLTLPGGSGIKSTFKWYKAGSAVDVIDPSLYTETDGVFVFNQAPEYEIYCVIANAELPRLNNISDRYGIKPLRLLGEGKTLEHPHIAIITDKFTTETLTFDLTLSAKKDGEECFIEWGDGSFSSFILGIEPTIVKHHFADAKVDKEHKILIQCDGLKHIGLPIISGLKRFEYPDSRSIESVKLDNNPLQKIDLSGFVGCKSISARSCQLTDLKLPEALSLEELDLSANALTTLDLSSFVMLRKLILSGNKLSSLDLSKAGKITDLDIKHNLIRSLSLPDTYAQLSLLDCSYNALSPATLPEKKEIKTYIYAPQAAYEIPAENRQGIRIDLSNQTDRVGVGSLPARTLFVWHDIRGDVAISPKDYTEENGIFTFKLPYSVEAYCTMETPAFPDLASAEKPFRTKKITIPADTHSAIILEDDKNPFSICIEPENLSISSSVPMLRVAIYSIEGKNITTDILSVNETGKYNLPAGVYILHLDNKSLRILIENPD